MKTTVASSVIASIEYNEETLELIVHWCRGGQTSYYNVPKQVHDDLIASDSVGKFFNANIKGKYADPLLIPETEKQPDYDF